MKAITIVEITTKTGNKMMNKPNKLYSDHVWVGFPRKDCFRYIDSLASW